MVGAHRGNEQRSAHAEEQGCHGEQYRTSCCAEKNIGQAAYQIARNQHRSRITVVGQGAAEQGKALLADVASPEDEAGEPSGKGNGGKVPGQEGDDEGKPYVEPISETRRTCRVRGVPVSLVKNPDWIAPRDIVVDMVHTCMGSRASPARSWAEQGPCRPSLRRRDPVDRGVVGRSAGDSTAS